MVFSHLEKYDSALYYYKKSLTVADQIENRETISEALQHLITTFVYIDVTGLALKSINHSVNIDKALNCIKHLATDYNNAGNIYCKPYPYDTALYFYNHMLFTVFTLTSFNLLTTTHLNQHFCGLMNGGCPIFNNFEF